MSDSPLLRTADGRLSKLVECGAAVVKVERTIGGTSLYIYTLGNSAFVSLTDAQREALAEALTEEFT